tara:strand:- start:12501 stop:12653 length:153 start_codon:yes stop_codon:yes gene_type:complete
MIGYIIVLSLLAIILYWLGGLLIVPQMTIQQELIKADFLYGVEYKLEEDE